MRSKILTLKFDENIDGFDGSELETFVASHAVVNLQTHFFEFQGRPYLLAILRYMQASGEDKLRLPEKKAPCERVHWKSLLDESQFPIFERLRQWRKQRAINDGVPPYIILHDQHLVRIVSEMPESLKSLSEIQGLGEAKLKRYAQEILALLALPSSKVEEDNGSNK
jgi:superfamily II DNA helicase RecQ